MNVRLVVVGGKANSPEIRIKLPTLVGRGPECNLVLQHALVSRKHCQLYEAAGRLMVRDLGSMNGTYVGNQRVTDAELPPDALLTLGTVTFRAVYGVSVLDDETLRTRAEQDTTLGQDTEPLEGIQPAREESSRSSQSTVDLPVAIDDGEVANCQSSSENPPGGRDADEAVQSDHSNRPPAASGNARSQRTRGDLKNGAGQDDDTTASPDRALNEFLNGLD